MRHARMMRTSSLAFNHVGIHVRFARVRHQVTRLICGCKEQRTRAFRSRATQL